jgi:hypothetical protein
MASYDLAGSIWQALSRECGWEAAAVGVWEAPPGGPPAVADARRLAEEAWAGLAAAVVP